MKIITREKGEYLFATALVHLLYKLQWSNVIKLLLHFWSFELFLHMYGTHMQESHCTRAVILNYTELT